MINQMNYFIRYLEKLGKACLPIIGKMYLVIYWQPRQGRPVRRSITNILAIL